MASIAYNLLLMTRIFRATACSEDWLEIYILFRDGNDRFIGRYCGATSPGPVESPRSAHLSNTITYSVSDQTVVN